MSDKKISQSWYKKVQSVFASDPGSKSLLSGDKIALGASGVTFDKQVVDVTDALYVAGKSVPAMSNSEIVTAIANVLILESIPVPPSSKRPVLDEGNEDAASKRRERKEAADKPAAKRSRKSAEPEVTEPAPEPEPEPAKAAEPEPVVAVEETPLPRRRTRKVKSEDADDTDAKSESKVETTEPEPVEEHTPMPRRRRTAVKEVDTSEPVTDEPKTSTKKVQAFAQTESCLTPVQPSEAAEFEEPVFDKNVDDDIGAFEDHAQVAPPSTKRGLTRPSEVRGELTALMKNVKLPMIRENVPFVVGCAIMSQLQAAITLIQPFADADAETRELMDVMNKILDYVHDKTVMPRA